MSEARISDSEMMEIHLNELFKVSGLRAGSELARHYIDIFPDIGTLNLFLFTLAVYTTGAMLDSLTTLIIFYNDKKLTRLGIPHIAHIEENPILPEQPELKDYLTPRIVLSKTAFLAETLICPPYGLIYSVPKMYKTVFNHIGIIKEQKNLLRKDAKLLKI